MGRATNAGAVAGVMGKMTLASSAVATLALLVHGVLVKMLLEVVGELLGVTSFDGEGSNGTVSNLMRERGYELGLHADGRDRVDVHFKVIEVRTASGGAKEGHIGGLGDDGSVLGERIALAAKHGVH